MIVNASNNTVIASNQISGNGAVGGLVIGAASGISDGTVVTDNVIGLNAAGSSKLGNAGPGVQLLGYAKNTTIGGSTAGGANVISGNGGAGIALNRTQTGISINYVYGNAIGVDRSGQVALGNAGNGISASGAGAYMTVGSLNAGPGNVIGSNGGSGVFAGSSSQVTISNNTIGLSAANSSTLGNAGAGVFIDAAAFGQISDNTVSGNALHGVDIFHATGKVLIWDNQIGLNAAGTATDPNGQDGVVINGSNGVQVQGNVISGNGSQGGWGGLDIGAGEASQGTSVRNNIIGLNAQGTAAVGNLGFGIRVSNASTGTTIGGSSGGIENTISGNQGDGILLQGGSTQVLGNNIGTDESGSAAMSNAGYGVDIQTAAATVGGATPMWAT